MTTRTRIRNDGSYTAEVYVWDIPGPSYAVDSYGIGAQTSYQSITDVPTPGYAALRKRGEVIMSPATIETYEVSEPYQVLTANGPPNWGRREWRGRIASALYSDLPIPASYTSDLSAVKASIVNEVYAQAYNGASQLGVTIAEGNKTLQMIKKPMDRSRSLVHKMIARKASLLKRGASAAEAISSAWLEYRLGWKPVLYDIQNVMEATANHLINNRTTEQQVARKTKTISTSSSRDRSLGATLKFNSGSARDSKVWVDKVSAGVIYETRILSDDGIVSERVRHNYGLQLRDVARTGWELIPFSFVVDRFVDIGTWLEAIQPNPNVSIKGSWRSTKSDVFSSSHILGLTVNTSPPCRTQASQPRIAKRTTLVREVGVAPSTFPVLNVGSLSLQQHADHAALITGLLIGFKTRS